MENIMKMKRISLPVLVVIACIAAAQAQSVPVQQPSAQVTPRVAENYGKLPLSFEPNQGQTDPQVKFLSRGSGYSLFLTPTEAVLALQKPAPAKHDKSPAHNSATPASILTMKLVGGNPAAKITGSDQQAGKSNYFIGNDPTKWHTNVSNYSKVEYTDIYPGIDLVYYGNQRQLEHDFIVAPGADAKTITLAFEGAKKISLNAHGDLLLATRDGEVQLKQPVLYQQIAGVKQPIPGRYILKSKNRIGFAISAYDHSEPLVIDPILSYSTYLGGRGADQAIGIAADASGNTYVTGGTASADFPTANALYPTYRGGTEDAFVTKLNATGSLVYSSFLGGSNFDRANGIAVDSSGNAYIAGSTDSTDFPTANALFPTLHSGAIGNAFVTKLNATGSSLLYSTYLGGSTSDAANGIAVDTTGNVYVAGTTQSADFPTANALFATYNGMGDAFVTKLKPDGSALMYSTYFGGSGIEHCSAIAIDSSGNAYITGATDSSVLAPNDHFPLVNSLRSDGGGAFVAKFNAAGSALVYSTYLGGSNGDSRGTGIAADSAGNAYITGDDYPRNAFFIPYTSGFGTGGGLGGEASFIVKLSSSGSVVYADSLSSDGPGTYAASIAVDPSGNAYVAGLTNSDGFPTINALFPNVGLGFVSEIDPAGSTLVFSTLIPGAGGFQGFGEPVPVAVDNAGDIYVAGSTNSTTFPVTPNAAQTNFAGGLSDAFVLKISPAPGPAITLLPSALVFGDKPVNGPIDGPTLSATLTNIGSTILSIGSFAVTGADPEDFSHTTTTCGNTLAPGANCTVTVFFTPTAPGSRTAVLTVTGNASNAQQQQVTLSGFGDAPLAVVSPTSFSFGNQTLTSSSAPVPITLSNEGTFPLTISSITVTGANPGDFRQTNNCPFAGQTIGTLPIGASCTINVIFAPTAIGTRHAFISIQDNSAITSALQQVALSGTGIRGQTTLAFAASRQIPIGTIGTVTNNVGNHFVAADFNNDGKTDLVVSTDGPVTESDGTSTFLQLLTGDGAGNFTRTAIPQLTAPASGLITADFNHDGKQDVVAIVGDTTGPAGPVPGYFVVLLGDGKGNFRIGTTVRTLNGVPQFVKGDFNRDGNVDLAIVTAIGTDRNSLLKIYLNRGDGTFTQTPSTTVRKNSSLIAADFNGDGRTDLALAVPGVAGGGVVNLYLSQGNGTFFPGGSPVFTTPLISFAAADLNSDGKADPVASLTAIQNGLGHAKVATLLSKPTGGFSYNAVSTAIAPTSLSLVDVNGDGLLDVVGVDSTSGQAFVFTGRGGGLFNPANRFPTQPGSSAILATSLTTGGPVDLIFLTTPTPPTNQPYLGLLTQTSK